MYYWTLIYNGLRGQLHSVDLANLIAEEKYEKNANQAESTKYQTPPQNKKKKKKYCLRCNVTKSRM